MAYINVDEVYILDNTGAQVDAVADIPFKADAGLTDAQKAQARANLGISAGGGGGGRNLLDNPWWGSGEVVNQRGATTITLTGNAQYFIDRWTAILYNGACTINLGANGITLSPTSPALGYMRQKLPNGSVLNGKVITSSVMLSDGTIYSGTLTRAAGTTQVFYNANNLYIALTDADLWYVRVGDTKTIRAVKLEKGTVSTLANDAPPDYGTELAKCQYYFERIYADGANVSIANGFANSANIMYCSFMIKPKRIKPSVSYDAGLGIGTGALSSFTSTSVTVQGFSPDTGHITLQCNTTGMTANAAYRAGVMQGHYLDFSADL